MRSRSPLKETGQTELETVLGNPIDDGARNQNVELVEGLERLFLRPVEEHYVTEQKIDIAAEFAKRIPRVFWYVPAVNELFLQLFRVLRHYLL